MAKRDASHAWQARVVRLEVDGGVAWLRYQLALIHRVEVDERQRLLHKRGDALFDAAVLAVDRGPDVRANGFGADFVLDAVDLADVLEHGAGDNSQQVDTENEDLLARVVRDDVKLRRCARPRLAANPQRAVCQNAPR